MSELTEVRGVVLGGTGGVWQVRMDGGETIDASLRESTGCAEALFLSTCNRVEVYLVSSHPIANDAIARCLRASHLAEETDDAAAYRALKPVLESRGVYITRL